MYIAKSPFVLCRCARRR